MRNVFQNVASNQKLADDQLSLVDGVGLTPLHYALIYKNIEIVLDIIKRRCWTEDMHYIKSKDMQKLLSYTSLCALKMRDCGDISTILPEINTSVRNALEEIKSLKKRKESIEREEIFHAVGQSMANATYRANERQWYSDEYEENLQKINNAREKISERQEVLRSSLEDIEKEIAVAEHNLYKIMNSQIEQALNDIGDLPDRKPEIQFFMQLYENAEGLENLTHIYKELEITNKFRMYCSNQFSFLLPASIELDLPYREILIEEGRILDDQAEKWSAASKKNKDKVKVQKKNKVEKWFSDEATSNISKLKEEYRELAKKYHPDVCKDENAKEVFQEITRKYTELIDQLSK